MWKNYLKIAWRNLLRSKVFSLINVGGLALGLTCCMLILLYITDEASFDRFQEQGADLYRIKVTFASDQDTSTIASTNAIHGPSFKMEIPEIREAIRTQSQETVFRKDGELLSSQVLFADPGFFKVFSFPLLIGDADRVLSDIGSIVLTEDMAESYFGTMDVIGKVIEIKLGDDFEPFTVSGVAKSIPQNSSIQFDSIISFQFQESKGWTDSAWMGFYMNTFVLLDHRADYHELGAKMDRVFAANTTEGDAPGEGQQVSFGLQPFLDIHLDANLAGHRNGLTYGSNPIYSYILGAIGLFILAIACINFINLAVARSLKRAKEVGIRKVVGGKRKQLISQFLTESFFLTFIAFLLAFILTQLVLPTFNELSNKHLAFSYLLNIKLIGLFTALFLATALIAGFYPAVVLSGFSPSKSLYQRGKLVRQSFISKGLVVFQFTLSICLVVGTIVIFSQFNYLTTVDLGYNDQNLVRLNGFRGVKTDLKVIQQEFEALPGIESVGIFNGNYNGTGAKIGEESVNFGYIGVDEKFLSTMEIPVVEGRNFSSDFPSDPTESIIVNEAFLQEMGWNEAVGKEVNFEWKNKKMTIVGVIKDYHYASLREKIAPLVLTQDPDYRLQSFFLKLNPTYTGETLKGIEEVFRKHVPYMPFDYSFEDLNNFKRYESEAKWKEMVTVGAVLSIFVSCIGLFGLAAFNTESRVKEIGVRKVIGASIFGIVKLLSVDFIKMVLIAILIAFPVSYFGVQIWLREFAYQIEIQWWFFALTAVLGIGVAMLTVGIEAFRAARMNPVKSLKSE
ncbi:ABC transporter permease [Algoriphagus yeomjeoni]|uniref:ABC-type antimicrobial peptide transport system permease subunit n=1 Tax=Algoriphagus yeomjeoni TaxID=291403 RepID=A0A327P9X9_9BACT|nr:ABC transporter permease [Algoriphagus yeomjeoni]RAI88401.1 ABC-type antimicrobial peptide transport system permease subunit [Algoriphagus yeomjeoni]